MPTQIDVQETLKIKLGVDFRKYKILGACNPLSAHQAIPAVAEQEHAPPPPRKDSKENRDQIT